MRGRCRRNALISGKAGKRLQRQHVERGLQLTAGMAVAGAAGYCDAFFVEIAGLFDVAELFERLAAVKIRGDVIGIVLEQRAELSHRAVQFTALHQLHRQAVARESVGGILRQHLLEDFGSFWGSIGHTYVLLYRAMACPYFFPVARFESSPWSVPPRMPLGDAFAGECRAPGCCSQPEESRVREVCNIGYSRAICERFPRDAAASDAIRFHVAKDDGTLIQVQYVYERDCWPCGHGTMEWRDAAFPTGDEILRRQAEAFIETYLRRRDGA
jgi:hypothetical protein